MRQAGARPREYCGKAEVRSRRSLESPGNFTKISGWTRLGSEPSILLFDSKAQLCEPDPSCRYCAPQRHWVAPPRGTDQRGVALSETERRSPRALQVCCCIGAADGDGTERSQVRSGGDASSLCCLSLALSIFSPIFGHGCGTRLPGLRHAWGPLRLP